MDSVTENRKCNRNIEIPNSVFWIIFAKMKRFKQNLSIPTTNSNVNKDVLKEIESTRKLKDRKFL